MLLRKIAVDNRKARTDLFDRPGTGESEATEVAEENIEIEEEPAGEI